MHKDCVDTSGTFTYCLGGECTYWVLMGSSCQYSEDRYGTCTAKGVCEPNCQSDGDCTKVPPGYAKGCYFASCFTGSCLYGPLARFPCKISLPGSSQLRQGSCTVRGRCAAVSCPNRNMQCFSDDDCCGGTATAPMVCLPRGSPNPTWRCGPRPRGPRRNNSTAPAAGGKK